MTLTQIAHLPLPHPTLHDSRKDFISRLNMGTKMQLQSALQGEEKPHCSLGKGLPEWRKAQTHRGSIGSAHLLGLGISSPWRAKIITIFRAQNSGCLKQSFLKRQPSGRTIFPSCLSSESLLTDALHWGRRCGLPAFLPVPA